MADTTPEEILCAFMEPKPTKPWNDGYQPFDPSAPACPWKWWRWDGMAYPWGGAACPIKITLNECHEIEARLTDRQWKQYENLLDIDGPPEWRWQKRWIHASAEQKIAALACVIGKEADRGN